MKVGIDSADAAAPLYETTTPDRLYRYQLLANWFTVLVQKQVGIDGQYRTTYVIRHGICNCQGYGFRGDCKHVDIAQALTRAAREKHGAPTS